MSDALKVFLDSVAAGDDGRTEEAALALGHRSAKGGSTAQLSISTELDKVSPKSELDKDSRRSLDDAVMPSLRALLADADTDRRWWAARALAAVGIPAARDLLIAALTDPDPDVRACAAQGLGELDAEEAVAGLVRCMADPSPFVSRIAADGLARIGPPAVTALIAALQEGEVLARAGAARALSFIQPEDAIPALYAALDDPSAVVTYYAEEALERMGVGLVFFRP